MKLLHYISTLALALLVLAGCTDETTGPDSSREGTTYLLLQLKVPSGSRANPSGGEDGDGREEGTDKESTIHNLCVFFYNSPDGLNAAADTPLLHAFHVPVFVPDAVGTIEYKVPLTYKPADGERLVVVANMGDITSISTLGELRRHIVAKAWDEASLPGDCSRFTMASAKPDDGIVHINGYEGSYESPFRAKADIERTAARIDIAFNNSQVVTGNSHLAYAITDGTGTKLATLHLENIAPVNAMQKGTWLLKHVTTTATDDRTCLSSLKVCGDELTADGTDIPVNYVVEPLTAAKENASDADIAAWYGNTAAATLSPASFGSSNALSRILPSRTTCTDGYDYTSTLTYVNENTQHLLDHSSRFMTGLALRGVYEPEVVFSDREAKIPADYSKGQTFWRYTPTRQDMKEADALYFTSHEAAEGYRFDHPAQLADIQEFPDGVCYYNIWLRHANNDKSSPHATCPMEFGIVRNNIYRVGFTFSGPGRPYPDVNDPHNVRFRIFVRKWNLRVQPEIIM